jgi:hydroxyacylglutathione hydrolase
MTIFALKAFKDNYIWVIVNERKHTLACVDPGDAVPVLSYAKNNKLTLNNILLTHHHDDHAGGVTELLRHFPKTHVYGPADPRIPFVNRLVRDEDIVHINNLAFRVLSTPGHTSSHICYQEPSKGWLFCGDTLFSGGCGRVFDGTIEQLHHSIMLLKNLPKDTKVYCGHEYTLQNLRFAASVEPENHTIQSYIAHLQEKEGCSLPSTIALEKKINPFMRTHLPAVQEFACEQGLQSHNSLAIFELLREKKNMFI